MIVMILERVTPGLRGELSRWLIEPRAGVFVGDVSGMVRDRLWEKCEKRLRGGAMVQLWTTNNEQGFAVRSAGEPSRRLVDHEGLMLVCQPWDKRDKPEAKPDEPSDADQTANTEPTDDPAAASAAD